MPFLTIRLIFRLDIEYIREYPPHHQRAGPFSHAKRGSWPHNLVSPNITTSTAWKHAPVQDKPEQTRPLAYNVSSLSHPSVIELHFNSGIGQIEICNQGKCERISATPTVEPARIFEGLL